MNFIGLEEDKKVLFEEFKTFKQKQKQFSFGNTRILNQIDLDSTA